MHFFIFYFPTSGAYAIDPSVNTSRAQMIFPSKPIFKLVGPTPHLKLLFIWALDELFHVVLHLQVLPT
jgi:hypothetical protein